MMKTWRFAIAVGLLASLGACSDMMGSRSSTKSVATQPTVAPDMVRQVQLKLRDGGYYQQGSVDGVWGSGTESAVRSFQRDNNLGSSGQLDVPTLQALNITSGSSVTTGSTAVDDPTRRAPLSTPPTGTNPNLPPANNTTAPVVR